MVETKRKYNKIVNNPVMEDYALRYAPANSRDNDKIEFGNTCLTPLYPEGVIIYTSNFEAEIGCGLRLKKGIIAFSHELVTASPDAWSAIT
jgi:hypothetical protein